MFGRAVERQRFVKYLEGCKLQIDVWDADSELLVATGALPLRHLLRGGAAAVQTQVEVPLHTDNPTWLPHAAPSLAGVTLLPAEETETMGHRVGSLFCCVSSVGKVTRTGAARGDLAHSTLIRPPGHDTLGASGITSGTGRGRPSVQVVRVAEPLTATAASTLVRASGPHGNTRPDETASSTRAHGVPSRSMSEEERKRYRLEMIRMSRSGQQNSSEKIPLIGTFGVVATRDYVYLRVPCAQRIGLQSCTSTRCLPHIVDLHWYV